MDGDKEFHYLPLEAKRRDRLENEGEKYSEIGGKDNCFNVQMSKTERNLEKTGMVFKKKSPKHISVVRIINNSSSHLLNKHNHKCFVLNAFHPFKHSFECIL